ncbi:MAG TPA: extracellular solute-binding protein [Clostridiaceae bacterium]|nr:extracellular solute-binding protein [Clostridiaceae bacterium]
MKRALGLFLILALIFSFVSCSKPAEKSSTSDVTTEETTKETSKDTTIAEEQVTLTFTGWRVEDQNAMDKMNELFTSKYPNIKIAYNPVKATEYDSYLQTAFASGTAEDIVMVRSFTGGKIAFSSGKILPLTFDLVPELEKYPESALNGWRTDDGQIFAVPGGMSLEGVYYNKRIFDECGITKVPETMDELYSVCEKIKEKGYFPIAAGIADAWYVSEEITSTILMALIESGDWVKKLYNKEIDFNDPKYVEMLQGVKDLARYYPEGYEGLTYEDCQQMFISEQAAIYMSGSFELAYFMETNPDLKLGCFAYPGKNGPAKAMNFTLATSFGIYSETKHMDEALTYINWLASKEGNEAYANNVIGFFGMNPEAATLESEIATDWLSLTKGRECIHMLGYECMADQVPDYTTAVADTVYQMLVNGKSPSEAAAFMQEQMSWYFK